MDFRTFVLDLSDDDFSDIDDLGFTAKVNAGKRNRRKKNRKNTRPQVPHPSTSKGTSGPSSQKRLSFWEKKALAFEMYGEATVRPQDKYRKFLIHRRRLNNGEYETVFNNPNADVICASTLESHQPIGIVQEIYTNELIVINEANGFMKMINHLNCVPEFALDLEANDEHSYLGMTVLIQIGTLEYDFIIDCFPVTDLIINELKSIFENQKIIKYLFGSDNDILWLQRDFFVYLVSAIDVQLLIQNMLQLGKFDDVTKHLPFKQRKEWYHKYVGPRSNTTTSEQRLRMEESAGSQPLSYEKLLELFHPSIEIDKNAQLADFRPRETESDQYNKLLLYARNDVHLLLQIIMELQVRVPDIMKVLLQNAFKSTKKKLLKVYTRKSYASTIDFVKSNQSQLTSEIVDFTEMLYSWRNTHALLIDKSPQSMISDASLIKLAKTKPKTEIEVDQLVAQKRGTKVILPESYSSWKKTLVSLLEKGRAFYDKINSIQCHNCGVPGHAGWGCSKEWSTQSTKQNLREDDASRHRQVARRNANKKRNRQMKRLQAESK